MKQPVPITVSVALSDKEYSYPSWMRSQSIASPPPPLPFTCALQHFTDSLPAPIYTTKGGERGEQNERHTLGVKCFSKEHIRMTWPRLEPTPFDPESALLVTSPPLLPQSP